jgi:hypothetical protein
MLDFDGVIGANQVWRNLKVCWMMNERNVVALIRLIWDERRGTVARIN